MPFREDCNLRFIEERDLELVLEWRNSERIRSNMYTDHIISETEHRAWFERIRSSNSSLHFVFEHVGRRLGVVNVTDIDRVNRRCSWGFYIGEADAPKGSGAAMGFLALEYIFETLALHRVIGEAFAFNTDSIRYHLRLGFAEEGRVAGHTLRNGVYEDVVRFGLPDSVWRANRTDLEKAVFQRESTPCER